jgi:hypothetical protein
MDVDLAGTVPEPLFGVVSDFVQSTVGRERVA